MRTSMRVLVTGVNLGIFVVRLVRIADGANIYHADLNGIRFIPDCINVSHA